jgi:putative ATP-binding cassette transporter
MDLSVLTSFSLVVLYMKSSISNILAALPVWTSALGAMDAIESLGFSLAPRPEIPEPVVQPLRIGEALEFSLRGVVHAYCHEYNGSEFTLGPLDLTLRSGELVLLTGGNGSGKTTLVKILSALYTPESGHLYLNDELITPENQEAYRQNFSILFADYFLFEKLLGLEDVQLDEMAAAYLHRLRLDHKVQVQDGHLSTLNLSTGQRKRLALLVAYLEDRPVYIFDEWAAGQDPAFKDVFYRELLPELKSRGKLVLVVSHDDHYYDVADRIIKLDGGQIESDTLQPHEAG